MNNSNWPNGVNYGHSNFTGRFKRVSDYRREENESPLWWIVGAALVVVLVFLCFSQS